MFFSASIIEDLFRVRKHDPSVACAYFFFDGRDGQKDSQRLESLICSLIEQLSTQCGGIPVSLAELYESCHSGRSQPSMSSLSATLLLILEAFSHVYVVLDALDECAERKDLLKWIKEMTSWRKGKLHLLATSRLEEDITKILRLLDPHYVYLEPNVVTCDIERYINRILEVDEAFERWDDEVKVIIKSTLLESARGMYAVANVEKS